MKQVLAKFYQGAGRGRIALLPVMVLLSSIVTAGWVMPEPPMMVKGTLHDKPNTAYTVNWAFMDGHGCGDQANRPPLIFGRIPQVVTNDQGDAEFSLSFKFPPGRKRGLIKFTATDSDGNPSAYSQCQSVSTEKEEPNFRASR